MASITTTPRWGIDSILRLMRRKSDINGNEDTRWPLGLKTSTPITIGFGATNGVTVLFHFARFAELGGPESASAGDRVGFDDGFGLSHLRAYSRLRLALLRFCHETDFVKNGFSASSDGSVLVKSRWTCASKLFSSFTFARRCCRTEPALCAI